MSQPYYVIETGRYRLVDFYFEEMALKGETANLDTLEIECKELGDGDDPAAWDTLAGLTADEDTATLNDEAVRYRGLIYPAGTVVTFRLDAAEGMEETQGAVVVGCETDQETRSEAGWVPVSISYARKAS